MTGDPVYLRALHTPGAWNESGQRASTTSDRGMPPWYVHVLPRDGRVENRVLVLVAAVVAAVVVVDVVVVVEVAVVAFDDVFV